MMKGLHIVRKRQADKPIRWYVYAFRGGPRIATRVGGPRPVLTQAELRAALNAVDNASKPDTNTLKALVIRYQRSPEWQRLAKSTKGTWGLALTTIETKWGDVPLKLFDDRRMIEKIMDWRDSRVSTPRAADMGITVLSRLLEFARLRGLLITNAAARIPALYQGANRAEIIWSADDIDAFCVSALQLNRPHVMDGLWLAALTGLRREDLVSLTFDEIGDEAIVRTALKRSRGRQRRATIPLIPETKSLIQELKRDRERNPDVRTLLVNSKGQPWTPGSFTQAFNEVRDHANGGRGIVHPANRALNEPERKKHLHDVRGTFATRLCKLGLTDRQIADIMAWTPENVDRIRRVYVDDAAVVVALGERLSRAM